MRSDPKDLRKRFVFYSHKQTRAPIFQKLVKKHINTYNIFTEIVNIVYKIENCTIE